MIGSMPCPCQGCFPCRINRRRVWAHRLDLERQKHGDSSFVTLTYSEENLPKAYIHRGKSYSDGSLKHADVQTWLKRLRKALAPQKIRYFLAGEYGPETFRPHYHLALFGVHPTVAGGLDGRTGIVKSTWDLGHSLVGELNADSAMYVAGYVTKKMTQGKDKRSYGKFPEYSRMSLRPGIGADAVEDIARVLESPAGLGSIEKSGDVPTALHYGKSPLPLGRYLRKRLRLELGRDEKCPEVVLQAYQQQMRELCKTALKKPKIKASYEKNRKGVFKKDAVRNILVDYYAHKRNTLVARYGIYAQKETL